MPPAPYSLPPELRAVVGQVRALTRRMDRNAAAAREDAEKRRRLIVQLLEAGLSTREVAALVGLSQTRIQQERARAQR